MTVMGDTLGGRFRVCVSSFCHGEWGRTPHQTAPRARLWAQRRMFWVAAAQASQRKSLVPSILWSPQTTIPQAAPASIRACGLASESSARRFRSSRRRKCQGLLFFALGAHIPAYRSVFRASGVMGASV